MPYISKELSMSRRRFIHSAGLSSLGLMLSSCLPAGAGNIKVGAHLWVYASKYKPPHYDCFADLRQVFSDLSYAGIDGVELMESNLRHSDSVSRLNGLKDEFGLQVFGSSYNANNGHFWDKSAYQVILEEVDLYTGKLKELKAEHFGLSLGDPGDRKKTEAELDQQAITLKGVLEICKKNGIRPNLHNHTYELKDDMHDLRGTIKRVPEVRLGPDFNWVKRAGIDPVSFINTFPDKIDYCHLRDQYADGTWTERLGQGSTDFKAIAAALKKISFKGIAAIELAFPNNFKPTLSLAENWKISRQVVKNEMGW